mgnify:CR=1 FL=1
MTIGANILVILWILFCWTILSLDSRYEIEWGALLGNEDSKSDDSDSNPREKRMHGGE